jgi:guanidinopropionase
MASTIPMVPGRKASLPKIYGETPSFLGVEVMRPEALIRGYDALVTGVPWEGTVTWGSFTGCEMAPRTIRHSSARYGGFLPEYDIDIFDHLRLADLGDVSVNPGSAAETMDNVYAAMCAIYRTGSIPVVLGGDHSFTPQIIRALGDNREGKVGILHFDAHFDNCPEFGEDIFPRCSPLHWIAELPCVRKESIVHLGIRGPRNSPEQYRYARQMGATTFTMKTIRERGIQQVVEEALRIASEGTSQIYVTICSDCLDASINPGGPADYNGLFAHELFSALYTIGEYGIAGIDFVEVYPGQDPNHFSSHLASWSLIHALAGMAARSRSRKSGVGS